MHIFFKSHFNIFQKKKKRPTKGNNDYGTNSVENTQQWRKWNRYIILSTMLLTIPDSFTTGINFIHNGKAWCECMAVRSLSEGNVFSRAYLSTRTGGVWCHSIMG